MTYTSSIPVPITKEDIEHKRIDSLKWLGDKLITHRGQLINELENEEISEAMQEEFLKATDELLSVIILGIGGKDFDDKVEKEIE
jgi:hypothetical protein